MAESKLEIKVGTVSFSGEGDGKWLSDQLDKVLEKLPELVAAAPENGEVEDGRGGGKPATGTGGSTTLAAFLKAKNATTNKTRKFLATAVWLTDQQKKDHLTTGDVTDALDTSKQSPVGNASQCLNSNITKGYCHKKGKSFYVTDEGRQELG